MYIPGTRKIIYSYYVVLDESFSSALAYTSQPYSEVMAVCPSMSYITCATSSKEQTGNIITFTQFEEGNLLYKKIEYVESNDESGDESDDDSIMPPLLNLEETDALYSSNNSDHELMSREMLEYIRDGSQSHPNVNRRETCYKIHDRIK